MRRSTAVGFVAVLTLGSAGCDRTANDRTLPPPSPLPTADSGPALCGGMIPRAVAVVIAGSSDIVDNGELRPAKTSSCVIHRSSRSGPMVFRVNVQSNASGEETAKFARRVIEPRTNGTRLPTTEGYGSVGEGDGATKALDAYGITSSGKVLIDSSIKDDAAGRDPVADVRALLNMLGPKLAPDWPTPPPGTPPSTATK